MNLSEILKNITKGENPYNTLVATVKEVDEGARTCDVMPIDGGAEIFGVRLNALLEVEGDDKGEYNIPAVNSFVLVTLLDSANAFVSGFSVIDKKIGTIGKVVYSVSKDNGIEIKVDTNKAVVIIENDGDIKINSAKDIVFNNGDLGGIVKHSSLLNYLNQVVTHLAAIKTWANAHTHPVSGALASPTSATPLTDTAPNPPDMQNTKVKH